MKTKKSHQKALLLTGIMALFFAGGQAYAGQSKCHEEHMGYYEEYDDYHYHSDMYNDIDIEKSIAKLPAEQAQKARSLYDQMEKGYDVLDRLEETNKGFVQQAEKLDDLEGQLYGIFEAADVEPIEVQNSGKNGDVKC